jgi:hypothetical protein
MIESQKTDPFPPCQHRFQIGDCTSVSDYCRKQKEALGTDGVLVEVSVEDCQKCKIREE